VAALRPVLKPILSLYITCAFIRVARLAGSGEPEVCTADLRTASTYKGMWTDCKVPTGGNPTIKSYSNCAVKTHAQHKKQHVLK
jgi:hypothetical protein